MKYLLFVRNAQVAGEIVSQIGEDAVAEIYNLESFENYPTDILPDEIPINGIEKYSQRGGAVSIKQ